VSARPLPDDSPTAAQLAAAPPLSPQARERLRRALMPTATGEQRSRRKGAA
jgi:hypothetical protein